MRVTNVPAASNESVAEHAFSFYFALRRRTVEFHRLASEGVLWREEGSLTKRVFGKTGFPESAREEVLGVVGVGELGESGFLSCCFLFAHSFGAISTFQKVICSGVKVLRQIAQLSLKKLTSISAS